MVALEVGIEGAPYDLSHRHAFGLGEGIDAPSLLVGEVHLRPSC